MRPFGKPRRLLPVLNRYFRRREAGRNFIAGRISHNIFAEINVGLIFTDGSTAGASNTSAGFDWTLKTSRFRGKLNLSAIGWFVHTKNWERRWDPLSRFFPMGDRGVFKIQLSIRP